MLEHSFLLDGINIPNRVVFQPMEGCDCNPDGSPSELTREKYLKAAASGAGTVWFEANAVCPEGRTNAGQMRLTEENMDAFKALLAEMREIAQRETGIRQFFVLQLTHSGRQSNVPMIAYRNSVYEEKRPVTDENIVSDEYLDTLPALYAKSALLAKEAGFDAVDVKACHGYMLAEMLSAFTREGRYGGSFENRTRLYFNCARAVKEAVGDSLAVVARVGLSDMVVKPNGFGTTEQNELDLTESDMLVEGLIECGIQMLNVTIGNPYYNPHINRMQEAVGTAMLYTAKEFGSRGSGFVLDGADFLDRCPVEEKTAGRSQIVTVRKNGSVCVSRVPVRPIPERELWFEKVWNKYNETRER